MNWNKVGDFIKDNGLAVVASLLTGGSSAAIATGVSLIQSATGETEPEKAIASLKNNPEAMVRLKELTVQDDNNIRNHLREIELAKLEDAQKAHEQTQLTVRNGDNQKGAIKWVRPLHATASLVAAITYVFVADVIDWTVLTALLALPTTYAGLREFGKHSLNKNK